MQKPRGAKTKEDLLNDPVVKKAMEWLKSDVSVQQEKERNEKPPTADTALNAPSE